jgi:hypothetical protein
MARLFERMRAEADLPYPQAEVDWEDGRYRLDFAWPLHALAVEVDGYVWHTGAEQLGHDSARRVELTGGRVDDPDVHVATGGRRSGYGDCRDPAHLPAADHWRSSVRKALRRQC